MTQYIQIHFKSILYRGYSYKSKMSDLVSEALQVSTEEENVVTEEVDTVLICWEEWALAMEEHFNALDKFRNNPKANQFK